MHREEEDILRTIVHGVPECGEGHSGKLRAVETDTYLVKGNFSKVCRWMTVYFNRLAKEFGCMDLKLFEEISREEVVVKWR